MEFVVKLSPRAEREYKSHAKSGSSLRAKIDLLLLIISIDPRGRINKTGKPELLRYYKEDVWSRRINKHHRMVYEIIGNKVRVVSLLGHYDDK
ncbi:type II toxin-antitoxin system YoeB family toxin [Candidatus Azobacteroides pseudotrichonymphae]|uniref:Plasmid-encoded toxin Txe/YoeB n=1 Tax=Azobacteroides pseudotrichonymphae genomovar. CFP2 TaxID=511995 RepID=B6YSD8_AZOPC|nr:type II toxin-antitoxin system YoeB family toxin [Candidatus Azobacteroides pseudotrichonymphae]BAG84110.1 putative plasmid-encoded toxin Txe/YoeB [Candidatus Azobacteroides pseudotrichonymphae genomovar. CFP2]